MIRKFLRSQLIIIIALTSACLYLSSCATDSEPTSSDDDVSNQAEADGGGDAAAPAANAGSDDLTKDLDDSKQAGGAAKDEMSLENELDSADASDLGIENQPPANEP